MENTLKSNLVLPSKAYELDREEMSYVEGGGTITVGIEFTLGGFLSSTIISSLVGYITGYAAIKLSQLGTMLGGIIGTVVGAVMGVIIGSQLANSINTMLVDSIGCCGTKTLNILAINIPFVRDKNVVIDLGKFCGGVIGGSAGGFTGAGATTNEFAILQRA